MTITEYTEWCVLSGICSYRTRENFGREKLVNLANRKLFAKFSLSIFPNTLKMHFAYALTVAYSPNFPCQ